MKIKQKLIVLMFVLFFSFSESADFHILLVGDTQSDLREQVLSDLSMMHEQTIELSHAVRANPRIRVLRENKVSRAEILRTIDSLRVQPDDYLLFYYSGHGCRTDHKKSQWPDLFFPAVNQYVALDEIMEHLKVKKLKFGLIVADCCNNANELEWPDTDQFDFYTLQRKHISPAIRHLFENSKGWLVVSGAKPGEYSWATEEGGILTCALLDGMSMAQYNPSKNWPTLMDEIRRKTIGIQNPQYMIFTN